MEYFAWNRFLSKDADKKEKFDAWLVTNAMKLKRKLGFGKISKRDFDDLKKRGNVYLKENSRLFDNIRKEYKVGGFLPYIVAAIGILSGIISGATGVHSAIMEHKAYKEEIRHNTEEENVLKDILKEESTDKPKWKTDLIKSKEEDKKQETPLVYYGDAIPYGHNWNIN